MDASESPSFTVHCRPVPWPPDVGFCGWYSFASMTCRNVTSRTARSGVPASLNRVNFWLILVMAASNDQVLPQMNRTSGGRPFSVVMSVSSGSIIINSHNRSVYSRRTSLPDSKVSKRSCSVRLAGSPPPNWNSGTSLPVCFLSVQVLLFLKEYSFVLNMHWIGLSRPPPFLILRISAFTGLVVITLPHFLTVKHRVCARLTAGV